MSARMRSLSAAVSCVLIGWLALRGAGQQTAPVAWPSIEVWGVSGHSIGTIRVAQPTVNGMVRYSLLGSFVPADGKLLAEIAAILWPGVDKKCLHFNWIQVTRSPGKPPFPVDAAGDTLNAPFLDPPAGGYYGDAKAADSLPWFLDETPYLPQKTADTNIHNPQIALPNTLRWYAKPYSSVLPDSMQYDTVLVLVNDCTGQYEPLGGFHWAAQFPAQGAPFFSIAPFGPTEFFSHGSLVTAFAKRVGTKGPSRLWTIRPLVKP